MLKKTTNESKKDIPNQPKKETIAFIKAFAASFCVDENNDGVIFECFLN